jgi:hypothetical protein
MGLRRILYNQIGSEKYKMAAFKPELLISRLVGEIEMKSQRLNLRIPDQAIQGDYREYCTTNWKWKIQDGGYKLEISVS